MQRPESEGTVRLSDGRALGYAVYGDPGGERTGLYFHGFPGSRLEARLTSALARERGLRVVALDRPGYGRSSAKPGRRLLDWPRDVAELADALGIERFGVVGPSGGAPYALACARVLGDRLTAVGIIAGLGPIDDPGIRDGVAPYNSRSMRWSRRAPWTATAPLTLAAAMFRYRPTIAVEHLHRTLDGDDRAFFERDDCRQAFLDGFREAVRGGALGMLDDLRIYNSDWGFRLEEIDRPVLLWHGERDRIVPVEIGRHVAARLPNCRARFSERDGHFSMFVSRPAEILESMTGG